MSDHHAMESEGPWPAGWVWAALAAMVAAIVSRWLGDVSVQAALLVGLMVFVVYAVLFAQFWEEPASGPDDLGHGHGHDDHAIEDHHGHAAAPAAVQPAPVAAAVMAPAAPVAEPVPAPAPVMSPVQDAAPAATVQATKPAALSGPRNGTADALQEIEGVGPGLEKLCHELGIFHFDQIASWGVAEIAWMDSNLKGFKGRVSRDRWVAQAKLIGAEGIAAFRIRAKTNNY